MLLVTLRQNRGEQSPFSPCPFVVGAGGRLYQTVIWPKNLWVDTHCQTGTMTPMLVVDAPQCPSLRGSRRLGDSVTEAREDGGQREAMP
jgi:hypothetical protein